MALKPQEVQMDQQQIETLASEWKEVENAPLPDDDEDFRWSIGILSYFTLFFIKSYFNQCYLTYDD